MYIVYNGLMMKETIQSLWRARHSIWFGQPSEAEETVSGLRDIHCP